MLNLPIMKRIVHIISRFDVGGAESVAVNIAKSKNEEFEYHIVEVMRGRSIFTKTFLNNLKQEGIIYHRSPLPVLISFHYLFEKITALMFPLWFIFVFLRVKPTVIHCHTEMPDLAVWAFYRLFLRQRKSYKIVRTIHSSILWSGMDRLEPKVERFFQNKATNISISEGVLSSYNEHYGSLTRVINNGVSFVKDKPYEHLIPGKTNILFAGRFEKEKGIDCLVEIVKALKDDQRYHFHIYGAGSLQSEIDDISTLDNVTVGPPIYGIAAYMSSFDYLLMPSEFEGLGLLSVEASLQGLPVIVSGCKGLDETIPADWPLVAHNNRPAEYLNILNNVVPTFDRNKYVAKAEAFATQHFSVERMQKAYEQVYSSLL